VRLTVWLVWIGTVCLIVGLALLFEANRRQVSAIATRSTYRDLAGELRQESGWPRARELGRSSRAYSAGALLTFVGIILQAIVATIPGR